MGINVRGSLVVDVDGDGDAFGAGLEPCERGLLVSQDEGHVDRAAQRARDQQQRHHTQDQSWPSHRWLGLVGLGDTIANSGACWVFREETETFM